MNPSQELKSLKKALRILGYLNQKGDATTSQVAAAVGLPRSTANRILETFTAEGYLQKLQHSDYYRLTSSVQQLSSGYQAENLLVEVAAPFVTDLCDRIGWSISVLTPRGSDMVIRLTTSFDTSLALDRYAVGLCVPMMHSTAAFCYLANCAAPQREQSLDLCCQSPDPLQNMAHNKARVAFMIDTARARGYSHIEFPQYREGNIAVPLICDNRPLGGLVMRYIKSAMKGNELHERFAPLLKGTAAAIAREYLARSAQAAKPGYIHTPQAASSALTTPAAVPGTNFAPAMLTRKRARAPALESIARA
jgi:DNA-binding IclR family transcriptional regulator